MKTTGWARSVIDRFILAKLEEHHLTPGKPAAKTALIRRATYRPHGIAAHARGGRRVPGGRFAGGLRESGGPAARIAPLRRALGPALARRRALRRWRRPDRRPVYIGYGMAKDGFVNTFRYRDWVIDAFNSDLPYDRFVKAQIAADLLPANGSHEAVAGAGLLRTGSVVHG